MRQIKILLVDDHQIIIDGIKSLLNNVENVKVAGEANNGLEAINTLKVLTVDIVLMDIDMPKMNGIDATKYIKEKFKDTKVIILSVHCEQAMIKSLVEIDTDGYLLKNSSKEELLDAIYKVANGEKYFSSEVTLSLLNPEKTQSDSSKRTIDFTRRELDVLKLLVDGYTNKQIGEKLFISHRTVDTHRTNIMKKVGVNNIAGLISFAVKTRLVE